MRGLINISGGSIAIAFSIYMLLDVLYFDPLRQYSFPLEVQAVVYAMWIAVLILGLIMVWIGYTKKLRGIE